MVSSSNCALCVGPSIDYCAVRTFNPYNGEKITVVVAEALLDSIFKPGANELKLEDYLLVSSVHSRVYFITSARQAAL